MTIPCNLICNEKTKYGYCKHSACQNPAYNTGSVTTDNTAIEMLDLFYANKHLNERVVKPKYNFMYEKIRPHIGHKISCVYYGTHDDTIVDICLECETCQQVLISAEDYDGV